MKSEINASSSDTKSPPRKGCNIAVLIIGIIVLTAELNLPEERHDMFKILYDASSDPEESDAPVTVYLIWSGS